MKPFTERGISLDEFHSALRAQYVEHLKAPTETSGTEVDKVLNQCPSGVECCDQCAAIFCIYGEGLHFHHDGCSCCWDIELSQQEIYQVMLHVHKDIA